MSSTPPIDIDNPGEEVVEAGTPAEVEVAGSLQETLEAGKEPKTKSDSVAGTALARADLHYPVNWESSRFATEYTSSESETSSTPSSRSSSISEDGLPRTPRISSDCKHYDSPSVLAKSPDRLPTHVLRTPPNAKRADRTRLPLLEPSTTLLRPTTFWRHHPLSPTALIAQSPSSRLVRRSDIIASQGPIQHPNPSSERTRIGSFAGVDYSPTRSSFGLLPTHLELFTSTTACNTGPVALSVWAMLAYKSRGTRGVVLLRRHPEAEAAGGGNQGVPFLLGPGGGGSVQGGDSASTSDDSSEDDDTVSSSSAEASIAKGKSSTVSAPISSSLTSASSASPLVTSSNSTANSYHDSPATSKPFSNLVSAAPSTPAASVSIDPAQSAHPVLPLDQPPAQPSSIRFLVPVFLLVFATIVILIFRKYRNRKKRLADAEARRNGTPRKDYGETGSRRFVFGRNKDQSQSNNVGWREIKSTEDEAEDEEEKVWYAGEDDPDWKHVEYASGGERRPHFRSDQPGDDDDDQDGGVISVAGKGWFKENFTFGNWRSARGREVAGGGVKMGVNEMGRTVKLVTPRSTTYASLPNPGGGNNGDRQADGGGGDEEVVDGSDKKRYGLGGSELYDGATTHINCGRGDGAAAAADQPERGSIRALRDKLLTLTGRIVTPPRRHQLQLARNKAPNKRRINAMGQGIYANGAQLQIDGTGVPPPEEPAWIRPRAMSPSSTTILSPPLQPHLFFAGPSPLPSMVDLSLGGMSESGSEYTELTSNAETQSPALASHSGNVRDREGHTSESRMGLSDIPSTAEKLASAQGILSPKTPKTERVKKVKEVEGTGDDDETPKAKARTLRVMASQPPSSSIKRGTSAASSTKSKTTATVADSASPSKGLRRSTAVQDFNLGHAPSIKDATPRRKSTRGKERETNISTRSTLGRQDTRTRTKDAGSANGNAHAQDEFDPSAKSAAATPSVTISSPSAPTPNTTTSPRKSRVARTLRKEEQARDKVEDILKASWSDRALSSPASMSSPSVDGSLSGAAARELRAGIPGLMSPGMEQVGGIEQRLAMIKALE